MDRNDVFRKPSLLVCSPDPIQLHCPSHMYIKPLETKVIYNIQTTGEPEFISPSCSFKRSQPEKKRKHELNMKLQAECNHKLNLVKMIKQICEGRSSCELQLSQLTPNSSQCSDENSALHVIYQCLPDPKSALFEAICTDTYMEVNCNTERSLNALVILSAKFEKEIKSSGNKLTRECPKLPIETPVGLPNTICSSRVDITDYISSSCDGRTSCSFSYVCVPPELIITEHFIDNADERHSEKQKTNQRQPKEIQSPRPGNKISSLNPSDVPIFSNEQLPYIRADIESRIKKPLTESRKPLDLQMNPRTSDNCIKIKKHMCSQSIRLFYNHL
ncbi:unnamed protein product [Heterobilharzia americana]|nr:unnamed protein product [Heterobilharzia americana]